jgi:hypothetical protein
MVRNVHYGIFQVGLRLIRKEENAYQSPTG